MLGPGRPDAGTLRRLGVPPEIVGSAGGSVPLPYNQSIARVAMGPVTARRVRAWLDAGRFDLLHLHEPTTPSASWLALSMASSRTVLGAVAVVATFHTARPRSLALQATSRVARRTLERVDAATSVSWVAHDAAWRDARIESVVVPNGVRLPTQATAPPTSSDGSSSSDGSTSSEGLVSSEAGPSNDGFAVGVHRPTGVTPGSGATSATGNGPWRAGDHPRVTFVGRHAERRKGLDVLLRAVPLMRAEHPDLEVVVVGEGPRREVPGVTWLGRLTDGERDLLLAATDVYVAPNLGRESFGIVLLEALAAGAPVVASDLTAFRDVVTDDEGSVARLFPVDDHRALARDVVYSLRERRPDLGERGRRIAARHDWQHVGVQMLEQYELARQRRMTGSRASTRTVHRPSDPMA